MSISLQKKIYGSADKAEASGTCVFGCDVLQSESGVIVDCVPICLTHGDELWPIIDWPDEGNCSLYCLDGFRSWKVDSDVENYGNPDDYAQQIDTEGSNLPPAFILDDVLGILENNYLKDIDQDLLIADISLALDRIRGND